MYKLTVVRKGNMTQHESLHNCLDELLDTLSGYVVMRISKEQRKEIKRQIDQFNECNWHHKNFTMQAEKV